MTVLKEVAKAKLKKEGVDLTEDNLQATIRALDPSDLEGGFDAAMVDQLFKILQSLREKGDIPKSIQVMTGAFVAALNAGLERLSLSFREHDHKIIVNVPPLVHVEKGAPPVASLPAARQVRRPKMRFIPHRDMNGLIEYVEVIEDDL